MSNVQIAPYILLMVKMDYSLPVYQNPTLPTKSGWYLVLMRSVMCPDKPLVPHVTHLEGDDFPHTFSLPMYNVEYWSRLAFYVELENVSRG